MVAMPAQKQLCPAKKCNHEETTTNTRVQCTAHF